MTTREIALALGGGGARAIAHVGVLRALEARNIHVTGVAGVSGGAIVGAMLALELSPSQMIERFERFAESTLFRELRRSYAQAVKLAGRRAVDRRFRRTDLPFASESWSAIVSDVLYRDMFELLLGPDRTLTSLALPFSATAVDLHDGRLCELTCGSLHAALAASCAVPGLFPAQAQQGRLLIDGATVSELPLTAKIRRARELISVHLSRPEPRPQRFHTSADVAVRTAQLVHEELMRLQLARAGFVITIPGREHGWLAFGEHAALSELGETAAVRALVEQEERSAHTARRRSVRTRSLPSGHGRQRAGHASGKGTPA